MYVVEMEPREERGVFDIVHPTEGFFEHFAPGSLDGVERDPFEFLKIEFVVVAIETLAQTPARVEYESGDEATRLVAVVPERLRERLVLFVQIVAAIVADAVIHGEGSRKHGCMGGERERYDGTCVLEQNALGGHGIEVGCPDTFIAVGRKVIRPERVRRDEHDVCPAIRLGNRSTQEPKKRAHEDRAGRNGN